MPVAVAKAATALKLARTIIDVRTDSAAANFSSLSQAEVVFVSKRKPSVLSLSQMSSALTVFEMALSMLWRVSVTGGVED